MAEQMKALRVEHGGPYALAANAHAWLAGLPDPTRSAARKNAALWAKDLDVASADFATGNLYALALAAGPHPADAGRAGRRPSRGLRSSCRARLDRRALPRYLQGGHGARRPPRIEVCRAGCKWPAGGGSSAHALRDDRGSQGHAGHRRGNLRRRSRRSPIQPPGERAARCADGASGDLLPRPAAERRPAQGVRPTVRRASDPSRRAGRGRGSSRDPRRPCRRQDRSGDRRGLALRHVVRARAADGLDPLPAPDAAGRRRHGVRQHVSRLRDAVGADQAAGRGVRAPSTPAPTSIRAAPTSAATRSSPRRCIPSCAAIR